MDERKSGVRKISGGALPKQLHVSRRQESLFPGQYEPVENNFMPYHFSRYNTWDQIGLYRPRGGFWTSSYNQTYGSDWLQWNFECKCGGLYPDNHYYSHLITLKREAKIYIMDSVEDFAKLLRGNRRHSATNKSKLLNFLDFNKLSRKYDALRLTESGLAALENETPLHLKHWDCESTLWFNFYCFETIENLGQINYKKRCEEASAAS